MLQKSDDVMSEALDAPALRFVEKGVVQYRRRLGKVTPGRMTNSARERISCIAREGIYWLRKKRTKPWQEYWEKLLNTHHQKGLQILCQAVPVRA